MKRPKLEIIYGGGYWTLTRYRVAEGLLHFLGTWKRNWPCTFQGMRLIQADGKCEPIEWWDKGVTLVSGDSLSVAARIR